MTVVKRSRTDAKRNLQAESTLNFCQFTSSFIASVKTEKNFTQVQRFMAKNDSVLN